VDLGAIYGAIVALGRKLDQTAAELRADNARLRGEVASLRGEVATYHASTVGHGILYSELEERVRRLEQDRTPPKAA